MPPMSACSIRPRGTRSIRQARWDRRSIWCWRSADQNAPMRRVNPSTQRARASGRSLWPHGGTRCSRRKWPVMRKPSARSTSGAGTDKSGRRKWQELGSPRPCHSERRRAASAGRDVAEVIGHMSQHGAGGQVQSQAGFLQQRQFHCR